MQNYLKETIDTYNKHADTFDTTRNGYTLFERMDEFCELVQGNKILEVGCASGRDTKEFVERGYSVVGIDLSSELLKLAKKNVPEATFIEMNVTNTSFEDEVFDGIWANAVFVHLRMEDVISALKEVYLVLRPGGVFFFSVKQGEGEVLKQETDLDNAQRRTIFHDPKTIRIAIEQIGFTVQTFLSNVPDNMPRDTEWIQVIIQK